MSGNVIHAGWEDSTMDKPIVIHRDRTFEFNGERYAIKQGSDTPNRDGSYFIAVLDADGNWVAEIDDGFGYISEVRQFLATAQAEGWETLRPSRTEHGTIND